MTKRLEFRRQSVFFPRPASAKEVFRSEETGHRVKQRDGHLGAARHQPAETTTEIKQTEAITQHQDKSQAPRTGGR